MATRLHLTESGLRAASSRCSPAHLYAKSHTYHPVYVLVVGEMGRFKRSLESTRATAQEGKAAGDVGEAPLARLSSHYSVYVS